MAGTVHFGDNTNFQLAQKFTALGGNVTSVTLSLGKISSPTDNVVVEIQTDNAGAPSGTVVGTVATLTGSTLAGTPTVYPCSVPVTVSTNYWVVLRRTAAQDAVNHYSIFVSTGQTLQGFPYSSQASGGAWTAQSFALVTTIVTANPVSTYYMTDGAASGVSGVTDQPAHDSSTETGGTVGVQNAASFVAGRDSALTLTKVGAWLANVGAPTDNLIVEVQTDSAGSPSGTVVGTVATIPAASLTTTLTQYILSCSISLTNGVTYWIVWRRSGALSATNKYTVGFYSTGVTTPFVSKAYNGTSWGNLAGNFTLFVYPGPQSAKNALTTRGSGSVSAVTNTAAGPVAPIQITATGGGTPIEWYTPQLTAFTLAGKSKFNMRGLESNASANASLKAEIAICASDGTNPVVWGVADVEAITTYGSQGEVNTSDTAYNAWVEGPSTAVSLGQRLRFRIYVDDAASVPLATGFTVTVSYSGAASGAAGDTFVMLPVVVTESGPAVYTDAATIAGVTTPSSVENEAAIDASTVPHTTTVSGAAEIFAHNDAATAGSVTVVSSVDVSADIEAATIASVTAPSSADVFAARDAATVSSVTTPSSSDIYTPGGITYTDSATLATKTQVSSAEISAFVDSSVILTNAQVSSTEVSALTDANTVTGTTTPSGTDAYIKAPQHLLPISDVTSTGWLPSDGVSPLYQMIDETVPNTADYIYMVAV